MITVTNEILNNNFASSNQWQLEMSQIHLSFRRKYTKVRDEAQLAQHLLHLVLESLI
jgi:hypothetical protein